MSTQSQTPAPEIPPPIGLAPEGQDFKHPWLISSIISAVCFVIGFVILYATGLWANFWQWADGPFLFYVAVLTPVLLGFYAYGVYLLIAKLFGLKARQS